MKYLKLFEDLNNKDEYYKSTNPAGMWEFMQGRQREDWEHSELDELKGLLRTQEIDEGEEEGYVMIGDSDIEVNNITIRRYKDYWFALIIMIDRDTTEFYICDQFDGLIECLEDLGIK